jgi:hypothetical protein
VGGAPTPRVSITAPPPAGAWYRRWWVWTIAAGVVAGAATGAYFATRSSGPGAPVVHVPSP